MREVAARLWIVERIRLLVFVVAVGAAAVVALGGLLGKSSAWTGSLAGNDSGWHASLAEGGSGWTDGVKPWAVWAFVGGLMVVALLLIGRSRGDGLWLLAGAGAFLLWHAGNEASAYRARIEQGMFRGYDYHLLSFGLRVVPIAGMVGAVAVALVAALTLASIALRRAEWQRASASS